MTDDETTLQPADPEATLDRMRRRLPPGVDLDAPLVHCEVCRGADPATVPAWQVGTPGVCDEHAPAVRHSHAVSMLRSVLPPDVLPARPDDLHPDLVRWAPLAGEGVYLHGEPGRGKTWQAAVLVKRHVITAQRETGRFPTVLWLPATEGIEAIKRGFDGERFDVTRLHTADLLILDDIGMEQPTDWARSLLYTAINARMVHRRPTIYTSNLNVGDLAARLKAPPLASRIAGTCIRLHLEGPDRRLQP